MEICKYGGTKVNLGTEAQFQRGLYVSRYFPCHFIQFTRDTSRHGHPGNKVNMCFHLESKG